MPVGRSPLRLQVRPTLFDENGDYEIGLAWVPMARHNEPFAISGDPESAVRGRARIFVGLIFSGDEKERTGNSDLTFFTGASDLIQDIEETLGAEVELLGT